MCWPHGPIEHCHPCVFMSPRMSCFVDVCTKHVIVSVCMLVSASSAGREFLSSDNHVCMSGWINTFLIVVRFYH